jgi:hypothetical protein
VVGVLLTKRLRKIFQCIPVQAGWDLHLRPPPVGAGDARCFSRQVFAQIGLFNSIVNIATDFLLAFLPVPMIWHIQVSIRTKCSLIAILSLGTLACVAGIMKSTYNRTILTDPRRFIHDWYSMWNFIELDVGIIAASLPALKPLFTRFLDAARGLASGQTVSGLNGQRSSYRRQVEGPDNAKDGAGRTISLFTRSNNASRRPWQSVQRRDSEDSILPLQDLASKSNSIVVTRDYTVERR